jgi:transglutaminase-like putative cysteine protease
MTLANVKGRVRLWLPLAQYKDTPWQRTLSHNWQGNFESAGIYRDPVAEMEVFYADWKEGVAAPHLQIVSQVAKQERHFDITRRGSIAERNEVLRRCLQSTHLIPTDGLVRRTAERAIGRIKDPVAQGKAIYDWVVENTTFDPSASGIGRGDIEAMLDSGQLSGRSADISLLFVALCRSMGLPARPVFGLRIDSSRLFAGLGAVGNLRAAQHCRAEFYTPGYGWIPVDPADVRKSIHDERLTYGDAKLVVLRKLLFGFWEMNWIAFNAALDVKLQGASGRACCPSWSSRRQKLPESASTATTPLASAIPSPPAASTAEPGRARRTARSVGTGTGEILEARVLAQKSQAHGTDRPVPLFADDDLGIPLSGVSGL